MQVVPVIDLMGGEVVRGIGGRRDAYRPIVSQIVGDPQPATVAKAFADGFELRTAYVADLDAITGGTAGKQFDLAAYAQIAKAGMAVWLDAGIGTLAAARHLQSILGPLNLDVHYVIGLESLTPECELAAMAAELPAKRTIFSLDLKDGRPIAPLLRWMPTDPAQLALLVLAAGISRLIVLDLADVGMQRGTGTLELCRRIRRDYGPALELTAGGGVRGLDDLRALADAGCNAALVASALHDGRLAREDIERARDFGRGAR